MLDVPFLYRLGMEGSFDHGGAGFFKTADKVECM